MPRSSSLSNLACKALGNTKLNLALLKYFRVNFNFIIIMAVLILSNSTLLEKKESLRELNVFFQSIAE